MTISISSETKIVPTSTSDIILSSENEIVPTPTSDHKNLQLTLEKIDEKAARNLLNQVNSKVFPKSFRMGITINNRDPHTHPPTLSQIPYNFYEATLPTGWKLFDLFSLFGDRAYDKLETGKLFSPYTEFREITYRLNRQSTSMATSTELNLPDSTKVLFSCGERKLVPCTDCKPHFSEVSNPLTTILGYNTKALCLIFPQLNYLSLYIGGYTDDFFLYGKCGKTLTHSKWSGKLDNHPEKRKVFAIELLKHFSGISKSPLINDIFETLVTTETSLNDDDKNLLLEIAFLLIVVEGTRRPISLFYTFFGLLSIVKHPKKANFTWFCKNHPSLSGSDNSLDIKYGKMHDSESLIAFYNECQNPKTFVKCIV